MLPIHRTKHVVFNYDEIPPGYYFRAMQSGGAIQRFWHVHKFRELAERIATTDRVLDFGCGPGSFLWILAQLRPGVRAFGVDVASHQLEFAREQFAGAAFPHNVEFVQLGPSTQALPFPDASFDVVTMTEVIEHIHPYYGQQVLLDIRRLLKPGGRLLITTPNYRSLWPVIEVGLERMSEVKYHDQHINKLTPNSFVKTIEGAGFEPRRVHTIFVAAPFLATVSEHLARAVHAFERRLPVKLGSLLVIEAVRAEL